MNFFKCPYPTMSAWNNSDTFIPRLKSCNKSISLSKSKKPTESEPTEECSKKPMLTECAQTSQPLLENHEWDDVPEDCMDLDSDDFMDTSDIKLESVKSETLAMDDLMDTSDIKLETMEPETPAIESLSDDFMDATTLADEIQPTTRSIQPISRSEDAKRSKKVTREDVFTKDNVKDWQATRIRAWLARHTFPDAYYFRLVIPGDMKHNGVWSSQEHQAFMERYREWTSKGYRMGSFWGMFSLAIPQRVGYQCMNYYRSLVVAGELKDDSYVVENKKLKLVDKSKPHANYPQPKDELGPVWQTERVKQIEAQVDSWIKEIHGKYLQAAPTRTPTKPKLKPSVAKQTGRIGHLIKRMVPKEEAVDSDWMEPEVAHLRQNDWEKKWDDRLKEYKQFLEPYLDPHIKIAHWHAKQVWRRGLTTTEMLLRKEMTLKPPSVETTEPKVQQTSLSRFFTGVKKRKIDTPDDLVSYTRIPNDLYSGVKQIKPLNKTLPADATKALYFELDEISQSIPLLDDLCHSMTKEEEEETVTQSPLECVLADPPWEFYLADGKNDGCCSLNLVQFQETMASVLRHMSAGMVFVWTHKLIQADVVRTMYDIDCKYVENLVWFKKSVNNVHLDDPSPYFSSTKEILLMFKKGDGFEMRHQRSPDVIIDFQRPNHEWIEDEFTEPKPTAVYEMIETLLPKAGYDESISRGRSLELWAKKRAPRREGWIAIHVNKKKELPLMQ